MAQGVSPQKMIGAVVFVFLIAVLGAAFTPTLQSQVDSWQENLTDAGQTGAATVVGIIPLMFWILLGVGVILALVAAFLPGKLGL